MTEKTDVLIIGAGILGCFAARELSRFKLSVTVAEKNADVCTEISKANSGIIYQGYDQHPGSLKAALCKKASEQFPKLCNELGVHYKKRGLLMLSFGPNADKVLTKKIRHAEEGKISDVHLIGAKEVYQMEPALRDGVKHALYADRTYVADPWDLGIAAFENAKANGAVFHFNEEVLSIRKEDGLFIAETDSCTYQAKRILCCGGFHADRLWEMVYPPKIRLVPLAADYLLFDTTTGNLIRHILSEESEEKGEGITIVPTADGNLLLGPTRRDALDPQPFTGTAANSGMQKLSASSLFATDPKGLSELLEKGKHLLPDLPFDQVIRSFGGARPNPFYVDENGTLTDRSIKDFAILEEDGFFDLIGVKTPGITCAHELGAYIAGRIADSFETRPELKTDFTPERKAIPKTAELIESDPELLKTLPPEFSEIFCRCKNVSKGEVLEAIRRGAASIDGVKRRTGCGMGRCQGGYCMEKILHLLSEELGKDIYEITKDGPGTEVLVKSGNSDCIKDTSYKKQ